MKKLFLTAGVGLMLTACARQDDTGYNANAENPTPAATQASTTTQASTDNKGPRSTTELAGPDTAVGAAVTASSGTGTATAQGATANESAASEGKGAGENQNLNGQPATPPAGSGVQNGDVNTNKVGHPTSQSTPPAPQPPQ